MNSLETAYGILGLPLGTSIDTVRLRYKRLAMVWHPDRLHNNPAKNDAEVEMAKINGAKELLEAHFKDEHSEEKVCQCKAKTDDDAQTNDGKGQRRARRSSEDDEAEQQRKAAAQAQAQAEWEAKLRESETKRWDLSKKAGLVFLALFAFSFVITTIKSIFGLN
jgi:curved DNA-binding protein CbpA